MLTNKNIIVTGVGKGLGYDLVNKIISYGGFVYGITRSKSDLKKFKNLRKCKIFLGDIQNNNNFKKENLILKKEIIELKSELRKLNL